MFSSEKIKAKEELKPVLESLKSAGKRIVFTNGCFDLIHVGHIRYLREAKSRGDILVVALNTDRSVREIKGPKRPILSQGERTRIIGSFDMVDFITVFDEKDPCEIIAYLKPQVHVKGGDYEINEVIERDAVISSGGDLAAAPLVEGYSTSKVIEQIIERFSDKG